MSNDYGDLPLLELERRMLRAIDMGFKCYQKFTCGMCGSRQMMVDHNVIYTSGTCEQCGKTTAITKAGFLVVKKFQVG